MTKWYKLDEIYKTKKPNKEFAKKKSANQNKEEE